MSNNNFYIAKQKSLPATPRKLGIVADLIRNLKVDMAINQLKFSRKRIAVDVLKVLQSAVANAEHNFNVDFDSLYIDSVLVGKSHTLKRFFPRARGRSSRILKRRSSLMIRLKTKQKGE